MRVVEGLTTLSVTSVAKPPSVSAGGLVTLAVTAEGHGHGAGAGGQRPRAAREGPAGHRLPPARAGLHGLTTSAGSARQSPKSERYT